MGRFKDSPFEGFRRRSFLRSLALGAARRLWCWLRWLGPAPALLLLGLVYAGERLVTEWWKAFLREDPQAGVHDPDAVRRGRTAGRLPAAPLRHGAAVLLRPWCAPGARPAGRARRAGRPG